MSKQTPAERKARNAETNRLRYQNDPAYRAKCRIYLERYRAAKGALENDPPYRVRLLEDETVWFGMLAGEKYQDAVTDDGGRFHLLPSVALTGESSMAWAG